jgi:hypothetical protein
MCGKGENKYCPNNPCTLDKSPTTMEFLIVNLVCSYDRSSEPVCSTSQEIVDLQGAQKIIDANNENVVIFAKDFNSKESKIFTHHDDNRKFFKKVIVMRIE